jgi:predicted RNA methylase
LTCIVYMSSIPQSIEPRSAVPPHMEQTTGLDRDPIDKYYTKSSVAQACVSLMKKHASPRKLCDVIIEPSAGNGAFLLPLKTLKCPVRMYDIRPDHPQVLERDYLAIPVEEMVTGRAPEGRIHVVGNPPFGRQASLAIKFIKKTCTFADSISFILPKSFKKDSMRRAFSAHFHLVHQNDLNESSFLVNNKDHDSPCVFQVWVRRADPRPEPVVHTPVHFFFVKRPDLVAPVEGSPPVIPHAAIRRVGVYAGKVMRTATAEEAETKSDQTHYFIRFLPDAGEEKDIDSIVARISDIVYETDNTVGPRSISKNELIGAVNARLTNWGQEISTVCDCPIL